MKKKIGGVLVPWYLSIFVSVTLTYIILSNGGNAYPYLTNIDIFAILYNVFFLNGLIPLANNNVVFGGWYIGTLVIVWIIIFVLLKCYGRFGIKSLHIALIADFLLIIVISVCIPDKCGVNSFMYFSPVTQLAPVLVGGLLRLYQCNNEHIFLIVNQKRVFIGIFAIIIGIFAVLYATHLCDCMLPMICSFAIAIGFLQIEKKELKEKCKVFSVLRWCGINSLYIYLSHIFIVWHVQFAIFQLSKKLVSENLAMLVYGLFLVLYVIGIVPALALLYKKICLLVEHYVYISGS